MTPSMNDLLWLAAFGLMLMIIRDARALAGSRAGEPQGRLRAEHLHTHLAQTALMSSAQALRYAELRGTTGGAPVEPAARGSQHKHRH